MISVQKLLNMSEDSRDSPQGLGIRSLLPNGSAKDHGDHVHEERLEVEQRAADEETVQMRQALVWKRNNKRKSSCELC